MKKALSQQELIKAEGTALKDVATMLTTEDEIEAMIQKLIEKYAKILREYAEDNHYCVTVEDLENILINELKKEVV